MVPPARVARWIENFESRHGATELDMAEGALSGVGEDGSTFTAQAPFGRSIAAADIDTLLEACSQPREWGVLLVRKGGFAMARLHGDRVVESKVGQRHVQGRSKAGGQSQQRFARRRDNQARAAYDAAADHAHRILSGAPLLVTGGDHKAVDVVLAGMGFTGSVCEPWLSVPDPRRAVLDQAIADAGSVWVKVVNA